MGMGLVLRKVSDDQLRSLHEKPEKITEFLYGEDPPEDEETDLDKAWNGIHFLLTGTSFGGSGPASYLLTGKPIGDEDVGYGPALSLTSDQMREFASHLQGLEADTLKSRYNPGKMIEADIYPSIWDREDDEEENFGYLLEFFEQLKVFVSEAASENKAVIIRIS